MANCKICHQPKTAAPVICPACLDRLRGDHTETITALRELAARVGYVDEGTLAMWLYRAAEELERCAQPEPDNKELTCDGCVSFGDGHDHNPCFGCKRAVREVDCYRRPPEKGE